MRHILHACNAERCFVCDGGLALCEICGGAEASMPKDCPGYRLHAKRLDAIQDGKIDFIDGKWIVHSHVEDL